MAKTIAIQIGNSDDKLTQKEWSEFVFCVDRFIQHQTKAVHFSGTSYPSAPWQNAAWIFIADSDHISYIQMELTSIRQRFNQDSIAWSECKTEFI